MCGKPPGEVQFSNSQKKRLKKGKEAMCKTCAFLADSSGSAVPSVAVGSSASPDGAKGVTMTESSEASITDMQAAKSMVWHIFAFGSPFQNLVCACTSSKLYIYIYIYIRSE